MKQPVKLTNAKYLRDEEKLVSLARGKMYRVAAKVATKTIWQQKSHWLLDDLWLAKWEKKTVALDRIKTVEEKKLQYLGGVPWCELVVAMSAMLSFARTGDLKHGKTICAMTTLQSYGHH